MKHAILAFLNQPAARMGLATALLFQVVFSVIWMTGYDGVMERADQLRVVVVNEDPLLGEQISAKLSASLPFQVTVKGSLDEARTLLSERKSQLVVHIPADFTAGLQTMDGEGSQLRYYLNESNALTIKNVMLSAADTITSMVNKEAAAAGIQSVLAQTGMSAEQTSVLAGAMAERVTSEVIISNPVQGMNNQMVPMMLVLASYVGAMLLSMNLQLASGIIGHSISKWRKLGARAIINISASIVIALMATGLLVALGGQTASGFLAAWGFQSLFLIAFLFFSQTFLLVFGQAGMVFNIIALSAQLVSSGALVPRELLSGFYRTLGDYLPATYAVEGSMNVLFGGAGMIEPVYALLLIACVSIGIGAAATALRKVHAPLPLHAG